jgi:hypothetical protein
VAVSIGRRRIERIVFGPETLLETSKSMTPVIPLQLPVAIRSETALEVALDCLFAVWR